MKPRLILGVGGLLILLGGLVWHFHCAGEPRRQAIQALSTLNASLQSNDAEKLLQTIASPAPLRNRTAAEQTEFLTKALRDEISTEGLAVLQREGEFGPLTKLFPGEGILWADQAGVRPADCFAFKLENNGFRSEVVLLQSGETYRVVRCNNVKQLASLE
jgi:hypothetical protein